MANKLTLVTAYFDLSKREDVVRQRKTADYLSLARNTLALAANLVIFIEPEFAHQVWQQRNELGLLDKTCIIPYTLEQSPYYKYLADIVNARTKNPVKNANANKDTPVYILTTWTKLALVKQVCQSNIFNSSHVGWIDFGLAHVANFGHVVEDDLLNFITSSKNTDQVKMAMMKYFTAAEINNTDYWCTVIRGNVCAGFITAGVNNFIKFIDLVHLQLLNLLDKGYAVSEEQLFPRVIINNLALFNFYYSDYRSILSNYRYLRDDFGLINNNLKYCRDHNEHLRVMDIGKVVLKNYQNGYLKINNIEYSDFLLSYYISAFYGDYTKQTARRLFGLYLRFINNNRDARQYYLVNKDPINSNFNFINEKIDNYRLCKEFDFDTNLNNNITGAADYIDVDFTSNVDAIYNPMNWAIFTTNPSDRHIQYDNGDKYFALVRAINYTISWQNHQYNISKPADSTEADEALFSKMLLFKINNKNGKYNFSFIGEVKDPNRSVYASKYHGWEDCRVIRTNSDIWLSGTVSDSSINDNPRICLGQLDLATLTIIKFYALERKAEAIMEKNWLPYQVNSNIISFIYGYQPFTLAHVDLTQASNLANNLTKVQFVTIDQNIDLANLKGSASPIDYKNGKLILTHYSYKSEDRYYYRFVILYTNKDFKVLHKTLPFYFEFEGIEFSLSWILENDKLLITSSSLDYYSKLVMLTLAELDAMLF